MVHMAEGEEINNVQWMHCCIIGGIYELSQLMTPQGELVGT